VNVYTCDPLTDDRWPGFVRTRPGASVFHTRGWLESLRRTYGYAPIVYSTSAPAEPLNNAIVFCEVRSWLTGHRLVSLPFADHCEPLVERPADLVALCAEVERAVDARRWRSIEIRPLSAGLHESARVRQSGAFCFHSLDLRRPLDDLFGRFHKDSIQRKVRRAEREGLAFDAGASEDHLQAFYRLLLLTRRRHRLPPQPIDWFRNLMACLGDRVEICVASKDRRAIAAIVLLRHLDTVVYKYGASDERFHNLGGMPFLFWNAIQRASNDGACCLDLGRSDRDNEGLITFKDRLGAERSELRYLRYSAGSAASPEARWGARMAQRVIANVPDRLFVSAGRLLYRHFG